MIKFVIYSVVTGVPFGVLAQETTGGGTLPSWVQWGVLGLVIAGFVTRQLVPGWLYGDVRSENAELKGENKRLVQLVLDTQQETIPALGSASKAIEEVMAELRVRRREDR